jgi:hypothetical protein
MRGGDHGKDIREYEITSEGIVLIGPRHGLITAIPSQVSIFRRKKTPSDKPKAGK